jgi:iron complex outermembrane receptor protein
MPTTLRTRCAGIALAASFALSPPRAAGQEPFRQTVVVTAAATPVELGSVTRTLTVISREEIALLPAQSIADVLRLAASIDVRARGIRGAQTDFAVRGANFGQMLVLVDGVRLNDAQSGHHNGDIPVPLGAVERIEILHGPGSSLFGADAFGGTVNVITRSRVDAPSFVLHGGTSDLAGGQAHGGFARGAVRQTLSASFDRSSGFMYDRDFKTALARTRATLAGRTDLSVSYLWKEFGANNFYGGNAPSREWTNQTLVAADHRFGSAGGWLIDGAASYRTHGDRFVFNQERPAISDNRHRTHAALVSLSGSRPGPAGASIAAGVEGGGDRIRSSNLGDHSTARISAFGEWRQQWGPRAQIDAAMRIDRYREFGTSWSPSLGAGWWPSASVRLRASAGRAFRIPTFTERYYSDPANLARADVGPESAWAGEGGADVFLRGGWVLQTTAFGRADDDVIDWLRATPAERWQTYNIRSVRTIGFEAGVRKTFERGALVHAQYTWLDLDAADVDQLSKYVLDYAPHSLTGTVSVPLPGRVRLTPRVEYRRRTRSTGGSEYVLLDARIGRRIGELYEVFVEGTNLFDADYEEIAGVAMPGAAMTVSVVIGTR